MKRKFDPANAQRLVSEERRQNVDPDALVRRLPIKPGDTLADVGCGPGFFTLPLARAAAPGTVYGFDTQPEMLDLAHERAAHEHVPNARFIHVGEVGLPIDDGELDGVFCAFVLHETERPVDFLAEIRRTLRPGGWLALVEWRKQPSPVGPPVEERLSLAEVESLLAEAGFTPRDGWDLNEHQYLRLVERA